MNRAKRKTDNSINTKQTYRQKNDKIFFGAYPQSKVDDDFLIAALNSKTSERKNEASYVCYKTDNRATFRYFDIDYDSRKYRGVFFDEPNNRFEKSKNNDCQKNNEYCSNTVYWFEYRPIEWKILDERNGKVLVLSDYIIENRQFCISSDNRIKNGVTIYPNDYAESDIRKWLNEVFYDTAFSSSEKQSIRKTTVDNGESSTGEEWNEFVCDNTDDNVFLLSYKELSDYLSRGERLKYPTDYAVFLRGFRNTKEEDESFLWWLRSPDFMDSAGVRVVENDSFVYDDFVCLSLGVVPALIISL